MSGVTKTFRAGASEGMEMSVENSEMDELILLDEDNGDADQPATHASMLSSGSDPAGSSTSTSSQPPQHEHRCPICLNKMSDPTILSGCGHSFCYECILEWLKMKPQCPLCKSAVQQLKHHLHVPITREGRLTWDSVGECKAVGELRAFYEMDAIIDSTSYSPDVEKHAVMRVISRLNDEISHLRAIGQNGHGRASTYQQAINELQEELDTYEDLLNRFAFSSRRELFSIPAFRRVIYLRNLSPRSIVSPRFDIVFNTDYVRNHETNVREQLLEYVVREVSALTRDTCADIEEVMANLVDYLAGRVNRITIVTYLHKRGIAHPHQFLNNLIHFAGTGQSLSVYDQNSEFVPRSANHIPPYRADTADDVLVLNDEANADIQVVGGSMRPGRRTNAPVEHNILTTPHIVELDDDDEEASGSPSAFPKRSDDADMYISSDDSDVEALP